METGFRKRSRTIKVWSTIFSGKPLPARPDHAAIAQHHGAFAPVMQGVESAYFSLKAAVCAGFFAGGALLMRIGPFGAALAAGGGAGAAAGAGPDDGDD